MAEVGVMVCSSVEGSGNVTRQAQTDRLSPVIGWGLTNQGPRVYRQISSDITAPHHLHHETVLSLCSSV
jgi:hypothetical protein